MSVETETLRVPRHQLTAYFDTGDGTWKAVCSCDWETWDHADRGGAISAWRIHSEAADAPPTDLDALLDVADAAQRMMVRRAFDWESEECGQLFHALARLDDEPTMRA